MPDNEDRERELAKREVIPRTLAHMDHDSFDHIYQLVQEQLWLERRSRSLSALWNSCNNDEEKKLVTSLIRRFQYLYGHLLEDAYLRAVNHVVNNWELQPNETLFVAITGDASPDGSQAVIQGMKSRIPAETGWREELFLTRISDLKKKRKLAEKTIVLVEDFLGTGNKFFRQLAAVSELLKERGVDEPKVRLITVAAMEQCKALLDAEGVIYYCDKWLKRGISDYEKDADIAAAIANMRALESRLKSPTNRRKYVPHLGYRKSESLVYFEAISIPNNVFPIFWWPTDSNNNNRTPMFPRIP